MDVRRSLFNYVADNHDYVIIRSAAGNIVGGVSPFISACPAGGIRPLEIHLRTMIAVAIMTVNYGVYIERKRITVSRNYG
jgi:hypothetical protein